MIRKFDENFNDLLIDDNGPIRSLKTEYSDSNYPERVYDNMTLFLLSQKEPGFIEKYCLRENNKNKLISIRETINKKPELLSNIKIALDTYLSISYEEFKELDFFAQSNMLDLVKSNLSDDEKQDFDKLFKDLTPTKSLELTKGDTYEIKSK